jgi:hypothetical protein
VWLTRPAGSCGAKWWIRIPRHCLGPCSTGAGSLRRSAWKAGQCGDGDRHFAAASSRRVELGGDVLEPSIALVRCDRGGADREMGELFIGEREHGGVVHSREGQPRTLPLSFRRASRKDIRCANFHGSSARASAACARRRTERRRGSPLRSACMSTRWHGGSGSALIPSIGRCRGLRLLSIVWRSCSPFFAASDRAREPGHEMRVHLDEPRARPVALQLVAGLGHRVLEMLVRFCPMQPGGCETALIPP